MQKLFGIKEAENCKNKSLSFARKLLAELGPLVPRGGELDVEADGGTPDPRGGKHRGWWLSVVTRPRGGKAKNEGIYFL